MISTLNDIDKYIASSEGSIERLKKTIAETATGDSRGLAYDTLASQVNDLAHAEGVLVALRRVKDAVDSEQDPYLGVAQLIENGPDDTWSGRRNDVRRSYFDGLLSVFHDVRWAR